MDDVETSFKPSPVFVHRLEASVPPCLKFLHNGVATGVVPGRVLVVWEPQLPPLVSLGWVWWVTLGPFIALWWYPRLVLRTALQAVNVP